MLYIVVVVTNLPRSFQYSCSVTLVHIQCAAKLECGEICSLTLPAAFWVVSGNFIYLSESVSSSLLKDTWNI